MRISIRLLTLVFVLVTGSIAAQQTSAPPSPPPVVPPAGETVIQPPGPGLRLPELRSATMSLQWEDLRSLLEQVASRQMTETKEETAPPYEYSLVSSSYTAEAVSNTNVRVQARLEVDVKRLKGWVKVPVVTNTAAPTAIKVNDVAAKLVPGDDEWLCLVFDKPGTFLCDIEFYVPCVADAGVVSFAFPCPRTPQTTMALTVPVPDARIEAPSAIHTELVKAEGTTKANLAFRSTDNITVKWTLPASLQKPAMVIPPHVVGMVSTLAKVTERHIACESLLRFEILQGSTDTFRFRLPAKTKILNISGDGMAWTTKESGDLQEVEVKVNRQITDNYEVRLLDESPLSAEAANAVVPTLEVEDAVRVSGFVGVAAMGRIELNPGADPQGLERLDVMELPATVRSMSPNPILLAYKYMGTQYVLPLEIRRLEEVPVRVAAIERAVIETMVTEEGAVVGRALYDVSNNVKQFLRVELDEGAEVLSAQVNGNVVKPGREPGSGAVLIPLVKSSEGARVLGTFPVEVAYSQKNILVPSLTGRIDFRLPVVDIPVNDVVWNVFTPNSLSVMRSKGDLKPVRAGQTSFLSGFAQGRDARRSRLELQDFPLIKMGSEENSPRLAKSASPAPAAAAPAPKATQVPGTGSQTDMVAGVLPVAVRLPQEGIKYSFRRLIVEDGQPLLLTLHVYRSWCRTALLWCLAAAVSGAGILFGRAVIRLFTHAANASYGQVAWLAILVALVGAVQATSPVPVWPAAVGVLLALVIQVILPELARRLPGTRIETVPVTSTEQE